MFPTEVCYANDPMVSLKTGKATNRCPGLLSELAEAQ